DRHGYGNVVVIRHHYGLETLYGHLSSTKVKVNQRVKSGDIIGLGGRSGRATGRHLHFEIRFCGEPFNPAYVLDYENYSLKTPILTLSKSNFEYLDEIRSAIYHTVMPGENLSVIAKRYRTTVKSLCILNRITEKTILRIGRKIVIRKEETPEVIISKYKSSESES
ncbi:MAG: M23 family metallopeptidase, partial [Chitinispirillaceae bacterium]|nr:M23 family metallopeptidase [Chitinispirillaceae bacterium]